MEESKIILPLKFEEILKRDRTIHNVISICTERIERVISESHLFFFPEYTNHGIHHINELLKCSEEIIHDDAFLILDSKNIGILISAIYIHDIGMSLNLSHFNKMIRDNKPVLDFDKTTFKELWKQYLEESSKWTDDNKKAILGKVTSPPNSYQFDKNEITLIDRRFIGEFIRRHHPRIGHEIFIEGLTIENGTFKLIDLEPFDLVTGGSNIREAFQKTIGLIARSHGIDFRKANSALKDIDNSNWMNFLGVKTTFLMAILRIADYFLIDSNRIFSAIFMFRNFESHLSQHEFFKHDAILDRSMDRTDIESIRFTVKSGISNNLYLSIKSLFESIQTELDRTWAILGEAYSLQNDLANLKLKYRRVTSNLFGDAFTDSSPIVYGEVKLTFSPTLLPLLSRKLYTNRLSALRELVQNSVDACLLRKINDDVYNPLIEIEFTDQELIIKDNGIGMNFYDICNYFLKIGRTSKIEKYYYESVVGKFGIGVLSVFNLGNKALITTKSYQSNEIYEFEIKEGDELDKNIDMKLVEIDNFEGTMIRIPLFENIINETMRKQLKQYYFHYSGDVEIKYLTKFLELEFRLKWRSFVCENTKLRWNYRKRIKTQGSLPVESNYLNSFLVRDFEFKTYHRGWNILKRSIIIDYVETGKMANINLSREICSVNLDYNVISRLFEDIHVDVYANIISLNIKTLLSMYKKNYYFKEKDLLLQKQTFERKSLKTEIIFFNSGYLFFDDLKINKNIIILCVKDVKPKIILDTIKILPSNVGICFTIPKEFFSFSFENGKPSNSLYFNSIKGKLENIDLGILNGVSGYTHLISLKSEFKNLLDKGEDLKTVFENKIIPYDYEDRKITLKYFFDLYSDRINELKEIDDLIILY